MLANGACTLHLQTELPAKSKRGRAGRAAAEQGGPQQSRKLGKFTNRFSSAGCEVSPNANTKRATRWPSVRCLCGCKPEGCSGVPKALVKPHKEGRRAGYRHPRGGVFSKSRQRVACSTDLQNTCQTHVSSLATQS